MQSLLEWTAYSKMIGDRNYMKYYMHVYVVATLQLWNHLSCLTTHDSGLNNLLIHTGNNC